MTSSEVPQRGIPGVAGERPGLIAVSRISGCFDAKSHAAFLREASNFA